ncbi:1-acyl-sn-glycerol-3-phosphate acyltransferase, partial [Tenacibaculum finnmarkense genomovar ulcerans]|nr:1-acyl-sn-glycerol-3-phosphate acyltransferase [Tenacibaculum finnmarkense genomovar ulcerans]
IEYAIEQHPSFLKVLTPKELKEQEEFVEKRRSWVDDEAKNQKDEEE